MRRLPPVFLLTATVFALLLAALLFITQDVTSLILTEPAAASASNNPQAWLKPFYDNGRSRYNPAELELTAPITQTIAESFIIPEFVPNNRGDYLAEPPLIISDTLYLVQANDDSEFYPRMKLRAYAKSGDERWSYGAGEFEYSITDVAVASDYVVFKQLQATDPDSIITSQVPYFVVLNRHTGAVAWQRAINPLPNAAFPYLFGMRTGYLLAEESYVYTLEAGTAGNELLWQKLNIADGSIVWQQTIIQPALPFDDSVMEAVGGAPVLAGGQLAFVYAADNGSDNTYDYHLQTRAAADGALLWDSAFAAPQAFGASIQLLATNGTIIAEQFGALYAYDATNGQQRWQEEAPCSVLSGSIGFTMGSDGQQLYLSFPCDETDLLIARTLTTGAINWEITYPFGENNIWENVQHFVVANGYLYQLKQVQDFSDGSSQYFALEVRQLSDGSLIQDIKAEAASRVNHFAIANGRLYGAGGKSSFTSSSSVLYVWGPPAGRYLPLYDNDESPLTNPLDGDTVPVVDRDGRLSSVVEIAAIVTTNIPTQTATLNIYDNNDQLYKSGTAEPDRYGNAFWSAPLAYDANGYSYEVVLADGTQLPRRPIQLAATPSYFEKPDSLIWNNPPATIAQLPATLSLTLPNGFPAASSGDTEALLLVQNAFDTNLCTITGTRQGDEITFTLTYTNMTRGTFNFRAMARQNNIMAYSPQQQIALNAPNMYQVQPCFVGAVGSRGSGGLDAQLYRFERTNPPSSADSGATSMEAEIASIVPQVGGLQITLGVKTPDGPPPNDPDPDPIRKQPWPVRIEGKDDNGNSTGSKTIYIQPGTRGAAQTVLPQTGGSAPTSLSLIVYDRVPQPPEPNEEEPPPPPPPPAICSPAPPDGPDPDDDDDFWGHFTQQARVTDVIQWNVVAGVEAEATLSVPGAGISGKGSAYGQYNVLTGNHQYCAETGLQAGQTDAVGAEASLGPKIETGLNINLDPNQPAQPISSGTKHYISGKVLGGFELSYTKPTGGGWGSLGASIGVQPGAGLSAGSTKVTCYDPNAPENPTPPSRRRRCCQNGRCAPPPGGDHPDDTLSVVLTNPRRNNAETVLYWQQLAQQARVSGYAELALYADYQAELADYNAIIATFPADVPLTSEQIDQMETYHYQQLVGGARFIEQWPLIQQQQQLLAPQGKAYILNNGYYIEMAAMLREYGIAHDYQGVNFSPEALAGHLLIIPTGGLYGLADLPDFQARLERFVDLGGTLLVLSQPDDDSLQSLPISLSQVGYQNEQSCFVDAMTLITPHPMLSSMANPQVTSHVDGYMTNLPDTVTLLMERTKNSEGAFALYQYGAGRVVVTNMYDDWGRTVGQSSPEVRAIFRDVVRWALADNLLTQTPPNTAVSLPVTIQNQTDQPVSQVRFLVRNPNGALYPVAIPDTAVALSPGESINLTPEVTTGNTLGIWLLNYQLLDASGQVVQAETSATFFAVYNPNLAQQALWYQSAATAVSLPQQTPTVTVTFDQPAYKAGAPVAAAITISLPQPDPAANLKVVVTVGDESQEQIVSATDQQTVNFNIPADFTRNGLFFFGIYDEATGRSLLLDTRWLTPAGAAVTVTTDQPSYQPGEAVTLTLQATKAMTLALIGPAYTETLAIAAGTTQTTFPLPAVMKSGPYAVRYFDGERFRETRFDVTGPQITIDKLQAGSPQASQGDAVVVTAHITSSHPITTQLTAVWTKAEGDYPALSRRIPLQTGAQTLTFTVPFSLTSTGLARLDVALSDVADPTVIYVESVLYVSDQQPELLAIRTEYPSQRPDRRATLLLDWYAPTPQTAVLTLQLDGQTILTTPVTLPAGFTTQDVILPQPLSAGDYAVTALATIGEQQTYQNGVLLIRETAVVPDYPIYLPLSYRQ